MATNASNISMCYTDTDNNRWWEKVGMAVITPIVVFSLVFGPVAPQTVLAQQDAAQQTEENTQTAEEEVTGLDCTVFNGTQGFVDCVVVMSYYLIVWPAATILGLVGIVFDFSIQINLENFGLTDSFVEETWGITRDVANLFFIFILLYAGIATMLQLSNIDTRRIIILVILVAVLVNFSLFFTQVVIDVGNGFADVFYQSVSSGTASVSEQFARFLGAQELLSDRVFSQVQDGDRLLFIPVFIAYAAIALVSAWVLASIAALMFVRIAVLIFLMITAPIAFVAFIIPKTRNLVSEKWWGELVGKTFMPAIFLFFLFIIFSAGESFTAGIANIVGDEARGVFGTISTILVQSSVLVAMLIIAKKVTVAASGQFGSQAASFGSKALGMAAGGATGFAGRNIVGRGAHALSQSKAMNRFASKYAVGESALRRMQAAGQASYDVRGTRLGGAAGLGKASGKGGYKKISEEREKQMVDFGKKLKGDVEVKTGEKDAQGVPITETISATEAYQRRMDKTAPVLGRYGANIVSQLTSGNTGAQHRGAAKKLGKEVKKKQRKETDEKTLDSLEKKYWGDGGSGGAIGGFVQGETGGSEETTVHKPEIKNVEYSDIVDSTGKPIAKESKAPEGGTSEQESGLGKLNLSNPEDRSEALGKYEEHLKNRLQELKTEEKIAMKRLEKAEGEAESLEAEEKVRQIDKAAADAERSLDDLKKMQRLAERVDKDGDEKKDKGSDKGDKDKKE